MVDADTLKRQQMQSPHQTGAYTPPLTAQEAVLAQLRREILEGELRPGTSLRQDVIAERLGFSRVPVREALKILEAENLVRYVPRRGYTVTALEFGELAEIYNIRRVLEEEAVRLAMSNLTREDIERMEQAVDDIETAGAAGDLVAITAANRRYHFALFEPCGAGHLVRIIRNLWDASDPYRSLYFIDLENRATVNREHLQILEAVTNSDTDKAIDLLRTHRNNALEALRPLLER